MHTYFRALEDVITRQEKNNDDESDEDESIIGDKYTSKRIKNLDFLFAKLQNSDNNQDQKSINLLNQNYENGGNQHTQRRQALGADLLSALREQKNKININFIFLHL